jgi:hypothetical protein
VSDTPKISLTDRTPSLLEDLWAIAAEIKANMPDDVMSDHGWLYDEETGLPA